MPRPAPSSSSRRVPPSVAVVVSRYNRTVTDRLLDGARTAYAEAGGRESGLSVFDAPGAFELVPIALAAASSGRFGAVVALGCIIKGETIHDRVLAHAVTEGLVGVTLRTGVPIGLGVLTADTPAQAEARAGGPHGNKGEEAMHAALHAAGVVAAIRKPGRRAAPAPLARSLPDKLRRGVRAG